jgi:transposase-like protein
MDTNLFKLMDDYGTDAECRKVLTELRWPDGVKCPRCEGEKHQYDSKRFQWDCGTCGYQFSVLAGTIFQDSKLPLRKWFVAVYLMCESKKGMSSSQLGRTCGVSYKTAWFLTHRIRGAMGAVVLDQLKGIIEADETFVGGKVRFPGRPGFTGQRPGYNSFVNKTTVLGAVERGGDVRFRVAQNRGARTLKSFIDDTVSDGAEAVYTDDYGVYRHIGIADGDTRHETVNHSAKEYVRGDVHTNGIESVWSLLKRSIVGSYHQLSVKHLDAYLAELQWRFNNRENDRLFPDTLRLMVTADPMTYATLIED